MRDDVDLSLLTDAGLDQMIGNGGTLPRRLAETPRRGPAGGAGGSGMGALPLDREMQP